MAEAVNLQKKIVTLAWNQYGYSFILEMKKLRLKEVKWLAKISWLVRGSDETGDWTV